MWKWPLPSAPVGRDEAFGVAETGRRVAFGDGVDCSCRHSAGVVISGIYFGKISGAGSMFVM